MGLFCLDWNGDLIWESDLGNMRTRRGWGEATSPALSNNRLIVNWDHEDQSRIYAINATDGTIAWEKSRDEPTTWATPLILKHDGRHQVITNGTNRVRSYDLETGELIWQCAGQTLNAIPCPVRIGNHVFVTSGYRGNAAIAMSLHAKGDISGSNMVKWQHNKNTPYVPSPVVVNDRIYFSKSNQAVISCLDAGTGELVFGPSRLGTLKNLYASPCAAAGRIYVSSREGATAVIAAGDEFKLIATNILDDGFDASPAIVGNAIYLRGKKKIYCIQEPE